MPTVNVTHRKRLARRLAEASGVPYMSALRSVTAAAASGLLPSRLDEAGMRQALATLLSPEGSGGVSPDTTTNPDPLSRSAVSSSLHLGVNASPVVERRIASNLADQDIYDLSARYERLTGKQGLLYITSPTGKADRYVFGGGHIAFGRSAAREHIAALVADVTLHLTGDDQHLLAPDVLALLRLVRGGRVGLSDTLGPKFFTVDRERTESARGRALGWLRHHDYIEVSLSPGVRAATAHLTPLGREVLSRSEQAPPES